MRKTAKAGALLPVVPVDRQEAALTALAEATKALTAVARALSQGSFSPVVPSLPSKPSRPSLTVAKLVSMFLEAKRRQQRSDRYLRQLRTTLKAFTKGRSTLPAELVTFQDLEAWLDKQAWSTRTKANARSDVSILYAWAVKRHLVAANPAKAVELASPVDQAIEVHQAEQVRLVLEAARLADPLACRILALRYFAGVRSSEAARLREEDLRGEFIEVPAFKSKTRSRRLVRVQPNLKAWLELGPALGPMRTDRIRQAIKASGVAWSHNVARHSFVSHHLALFEKPGQTALEAGHSETILFRHYRALVTVDQARAYFSVVPK